MARAMNNSELLNVVKVSDFGGTLKIQPHGFPLQKLSRHRYNLPHTRLMNRRCTACVNKHFRAGWGGEDTASDRASSRVQGPNTHTLQPVHTQFTVADINHSTGTIHQPHCTVGRSFQIERPIFYEFLTTRMAFPSFLTPRSWTPVLFLIRFEGWRRQKETDRRVGKKYCRRAQNWCRVDFCILEKVLKTFKNTLRWSCERLLTDV